MRRVFGLGETVFDIIFKNQQPVSAKAGGSVLNALVSLSRLGHDTSFISELGKDKVGDIIIHFLNQNKIDTSYIQQYDQGQSALAMAFLNENNDAEYDFYKNYPKERLKGIAPAFKKDDIFLFGSFYAINESIREQAFNIVKQAKESGCIIIYDPNFRNKHTPNTQLYNSYITENISMADILRGSNEDFKNIFDSSTAGETFLKVKDLCQSMVYTANADGVYLCTQNTNKHIPVPPIKPISTIGAGDNFNAGIIHAILKNNILKDDILDLTENDWDKLIASGIALSAEVCMSMENYINR